MSGAKERSMMTHTNTKKYKTNQICSHFDISRATLKRWEREGLLTGIERDWRGWRLYSEYNLRDIEKVIKNKKA